MQFTAYDRMTVQGKALKLKVEAIEWTRNKNYCIARHVDGGAMCVIDMDTKGLCPLDGPRDVLTRDYRVAKDRLQQAEPR